MLSILIAILSGCPSPPLLLLSPKFSFYLVTSWREAKHLSAKQSHQRAFAKNETQLQTVLTPELLKELEE